MQDKDLFENGRLNNREIELLHALLQETAPKLLLGEIRKNLQLFDEDFQSKLDDIHKNLILDNDLIKQSTAVKIANILKMIRIVQCRQNKGDLITEDLYQHENVVISDTVFDIDDLLKKANLYLQSSELSLAMNNFNRAREISQKIGDQYRLSKCLRGIGIVFAEAGKFQNALEAHEGELTAAERAGDLLSQAKAHGNIASILLQQERHLEKAVEHSQLSLNLYKKVGDRRGEARTLNNLGGLYNLQGNIDAAIDSFHESYYIKQQTGDLQGAISTLGNVATIYRIKGLLPESENTYEECLNLARQTNNKECLIEILSQYGLFLTDILHEDLKAERLLVEAIQTLEKQRAKISDNTLRENFGQRFDLVYHTLMSIYQRLGQDEKALTLIDRYKCRSLIEFMASPDKARASISRWQAKEIIFVGHFPLHQISAEALLSSIPNDVPTALVYYTLIKDDLYAFLNLPDNPSAVKSVLIPNVDYNVLSNFLIEFDGQKKQPTGGLIPLIEIYKQAIKGAVISPGHSQKEIIHWAYHNLVQGIPDLLARLGDAVFAPIAPIIQQSGANRILFVPAGALYYFPLQAMSYKIGETRRYVIDDYDVFLTPNLHAFKICCDTPSQSGGRFIGIANPDGSLPGSEDELKIVNTMFENSICFFGKEANLSAISSVTNRCSIFHIATHGIFNPESSDKSGLIIAKDSIETVKDETKFISESGEITSDYNLGISQLLPADSVFASLDLPRGILVVLSACETATILPNFRDDYTGLTGAFLINGAGSVLSSFWPVADIVTCLSMTFFYQEIKKSNNTVHALNESQRQVKTLTKDAFQNLAITDTTLELMENLQFDDSIDLSNPFYWAAFSIFGKPLVCSLNET